jgi:prephenate dehydrogenase
MCEGGVIIGGAGGVASLYAECASMMGSTGVIVGVTESRDRSVSAAPVSVVALACRVSEHAVHSKMVCRGNLWLVA